MALSNRQLSQIAMKIAERFSLLSCSRYGELATKLETVIAGIERLRVFQQRLRICATRKWLAAAAEVTSNLADSLRWLARDLNQIEDAANRPDAPTPSLAEVVAELRQAEREFGQLRYDPKQRFVAVSTDPIHLEGMSLGDFEIRLLLPDRGSRPAPDEEYRVVALDPHPAGSDETVTHPHVRDEELCAGDAKAVIRSALRSGRVCDFFVLVRSVLDQYNPASAFVRLEEWGGMSCHECGSLIGSEDRRCCASCDNDFCEECMSYCRCCDESYCQGCLTECPACHDKVCSACLRKCADCRKAICRNCLEENQCPCQQEKENPNGPTNTALAAATKAAAN